MTSWTSRTCAANGIDIHYLRTGGDKPRCCAAWSDRKRRLLDTVGARSRGSATTSSCPTRGAHGASSAPSGGYRYRDLADDVIGLIRRARADCPMLLGHSMGGMTAAVVASQMGTAIRGVILADPTFLAPSASARFTRAMSPSSIARLLGRTRMTYWPRPGGGIRTGHPSCSN